MADVLISDLTADTAPTSDDLIETLNDPAGTPASKKVTLANAITKGHGLADSTVVGVASGVLTSGTDVAVLDGGTGASDASGARTNLGLVIGTNVQAYDADLTTLSTAFTSPTTTNPASLAFAEGTNNGTNKITVVGVASVTSDKTLTLPDATDTLVGKATTDTLTNKTLTSPKINEDVAVTATATEINYTDGVTSAIQTQLNAKEGTLTNSAGLAAALNDETGTGLAVFNNSPTFVDDITVGGAGVATGQVKLSGTTSGTAAITVPAVAGTPTYVLPAAVGGAGTFLKDAAGDGVLSWATPSGSGDVSKVGTPVNNQVGVWTGDGTLEGDAALTFDTTTDTLAVGGTLELGHASDTTIARSGAGDITVEGNAVYRAGGTDVPVTDGGTGASDASTARTNLGLAIGTNVQAYDADLTTLSTAFTTASASGAASLALHEDTDNGTNKVTLTAPAAIASDKTITLPDETGTVLTSASGQPLDATLTALAAYNTNGLITQTAADTFTGRTITGTSNEVSVADGNGVAGNPTLSLPATIDLGGKTSFEIPNGAGGTTVDATGEVCIDSTSKTLNFYDGAAERVLNPTRTVTFAIENPTASEDFGGVWMPANYTISSVRCAVVGTSTPSVTWTLRHSTTDRSAAGTEAVTSGTTTTATTNSEITSFNDATGTAGWLWLETTAESGTTNFLLVTVIFNFDA